MKKRMLVLVLALVMVLSLLPATASAAEIVLSGTCGDNATWKLDSNGLMTISGEGRINFNHDSRLHSDVRSVVIKPGVSSIGYAAFENFAALTSVTIPASVTSIDDQAFSNCSALTSVTIPETVTEVGGGLFHGCTSLEKVILPSKITSLESSLTMNGFVGFFDGCSSLKSFEIPESVTSMGRYAFANCTSLTHVDIPDSVLEIGAGAFMNCTSLDTAKLPSKLKVLEANEETWIVDGEEVTRYYSGIFEGCESLKSIELGNSIKTIKSNAFYNCKSLENISIPDSVTSIGADAFYGCESLKSIVIPKHIKCIDSEVFYNCNRLQTATIPSSVTSIEENAFAGTRLKDVYFTGTQEQWDDMLIKNGNDPLFRAALHLNATEPVPTAKSPFKDVKKDAYYFDSVLWAVNHDPVVTAGTSATTFSPNNDCTRAQMVTFLWRAAGEPKPASTKNPFKDVKKGAYYYDAVLWAVGEGITAGTSQNTFSPDDTVIRGQTVTFLWRMADQPTVKAKNPFKDVKSSAYYYDAVLWAVKNNITAGTSANAFSPNDSCTRAQIVTFLYRDLG